MNKMLKSTMALLVVLVMCASFLPILTVQSNAASYIYNWGTRGEVATSLSENAKSFYKDYSYATLASYSGGTGTSDAPNSALYKQLQSLMKDAQTHITGYDETKSLYQYTDCEGGGGKISSFYSGVGIGPSWGNGWNREHTWPDSKGLEGSDENDIMMLRPTATSENSLRSNKAYGKSAGYYNPNSESNGEYDLRGDVARIFLYVYVRWGITNGNGSYSTWGSNGVMESLDVLLEWMEADPVDTWELGRNDSVESITGTRNVFVDYPELAFLLFGEEIPESMTTPSGEGANTSCGHNNLDGGKVVAPTCTAKGYTLYTCQTAGCTYSYKTNIVKENGHSYTDGSCSVCGAAEPIVPTYVTEITPGVAYKLGIYSTAAGMEYYFNGTMNGYYGATVTSFDGGVDVYVEQTTGGYYLYFKSGSQKQYINLVVSGTYRNFTFDSTPTSVFTWDSAKSSMKTTLSSETCYIGTYGSYVTMGVLQSSKINDTDYFAHFYTMKNSGSGSQTPDTPCQHNYTQKVTGPTCTKEGYTTYTCTLCQDTYTSNPTAATGHSYTNGVCTKCNAKEPSGDKATIDFSDTSNRIVFNDNQQVWVLNGITVTNDKANSQNKVADFSNPIRCYAGSNVTIAYPGMTSIEIDCKGLDSRYVNGWLKVENATATLNNGIVTVVFNSPVDSFTYTALSAQSRANNITVHALVECTHTSTTIEGASDATCTTDGHTGTTRCAECNEILDEGETIPATGHKDDNNDGVCDKCSTALSENGTTNTPDDNDPDNTPDSGTTTPPTEEPVTNDSKTTTIVVIVLVCGVAFIGIGIFFSKKKF